VLESETGGGARPLAVTSLEYFAACAFQGFARSVLGGKEEAFAEDTPTRMEEGNMAHDLLRVAFEATRAEWRARPRDRQKILALALEAIDLRVGDRARGLRRASIRRIRDEVISVLNASVDDDTWDFELAEQEFGESAAWPLLALDGGHTHLKLTGKLDRVDVSKDGSAVRVIDYKRRAKLYPIPDLGDTLLQLPIYARVAARELVRRDAFGKYVLTQAPTFASPNGWEARWTGLGVTTPGSPIEEHVLEIVRSVRQGIVLPKPRHEKTCQHCGSDGVCRRPRFAIPRED
jgi:ATP-dependent helicase/DNAse subunit B